MYLQRFILCSMMFNVHIPNNFHELHPGCTRGSTVIGLPFHQAPLLEELQPTVPADRVIIRCSLGSLGDLLFHKVILLVCCDQASGHKPIPRKSLQLPHKMNSRWLLNNTALTSGVLLFNHLWMKHSCNVDPPPVAFSSTNWSQNPSGMQSQPKRPESQSSFQTSTSQKLCVIVMNCCSNRSLKRKDSR